MPESAHNESRPPSPEQIRELGTAFSDALLAGSPELAEQTVREAMQLGMGTAAVYEQLVTPALWLVGELWEHGSISVGDEHVATGIALRVMVLHHEAIRVSEARSGSRVLLATPVGEHHVVALRMVEMLLHEAGYETVILGADVTAETLADAARRYHPAVICLSSTMPTGKGDLIRTVDEVRESCPDTAFILGGRGITLEADLRPEIHVCDRVSQAAEAADAIIRRPSLN